MNPKLIAVSGPIAGQVFDVGDEGLTIGREPTNNVVIDEQWVSRQHCRITKKGDTFTLEDLGSHNGTAINDVPVTEHLLELGERIAIGGAKFLFVDPDHELPVDNALELLESNAPLGDTVQLSSSDALFLQPDRLKDAALSSQEQSEALAAVLGMIQLLAASDTETLPQSILDRFFETTPAERGAVLMGAEPGLLDVVAHAQAGAGKRRSRPFAISRTVLTEVLGNATALLSNNISDDDARSLVADKIHSYVCLPLVSSGHVIGAIYLDSRDPKTRFPERDLELLVGLGGVAANALEKAQQLGRLSAENRRLQEESQLDHDMVGESPQLREAQRIIARAAPTDATLLIQGESGTGKELVARAVHRNSLRKNAPLVKVDCTGLQENLLASELFGHERGAFTGAIQQKKGKLEIAHGGTVFLDEIGELPLALQSQLLRVLQDREFERVGGTRTLPVDIRLVAATNRDLASEVKEGRFREDLFYRLNVVKLELPPLRERSGDIELLARYFVSEFARKIKRSVVGLSREALEILKRHDWPGNVRELANTMERAVVLGTTELVLPDDLPEMLLESKPRNTRTEATTYHEAVAERKRELILDAVASSKGSITEAARTLGLHPNYLHRLIRNLDLRDEIKDN